MKASGWCRRIESSAPVSKTSRASVSSCGGVVGVGRRALRVRSVRLAVERREAIFSGGGDGVDFNWERSEVRFEVEAVILEGWLGRMGLMGMF